MIDKTRIERALREGPPFRTHLAASDVWREIEARSVVVSERPVLSRSWVLIAVVVPLVLALGSAALISAGVVKLPVFVRLPANVEASATATSTPEESPAASSSPDAGAGSWTATGSMLTALDGPAVLLADGRVLVAGGSDEAGIGLSAAELYDPRTGSWTATGDMIEGRGVSTATLLSDGRVLVAGGIICPRSINECVPLASTELYDPRTGSWSATGTMTEARVGHTATLLPNGTVLVAGGTLVFGDRNVSVQLASAELFDPRTGSWTATGPMTAARTAHTATPLPDGRVLVAGGSMALNGSWGILASAELYDPRTGSWTGTGTMTAARTGHTATRLSDGAVLVAGTGDASASAELYDPRTGSWTATGTMHERRGSHTATLLPDGRVLVAGGANGPSDHHVTSTTELYDPRTGSWSTTGSLGLVRKFHTATLLPDGSVLVTGGTDRPTSLGWHRLATAELYVPDSGN